jgi:hypothetical protein
MKSILISAATLIAFSLGAQTETKKDTSWSRSGFFGVTGSMTELSDWQGGGQPNTSISGILNFEAKWKGKNSMMWTNKFDGQYGILRQGYKGGFRKNTDQLFFLSKFNSKSFNEHWFYAAQLDFRTQFAPGYTYDGDQRVGRALSDITSPAYIQLAFGLDYKPVPYFSALIAPVAAKITMVNRQYLADAGAFGVTPAVLDANGTIVTAGEKIRMEAGGRVIVKFKKDLIKNLNLDSYLDLFSNYLNNPGNIDVIFNNLVTYKIGKVFSASLICQMVYDDDIIRIREMGGSPVEADFEGDIRGPRLQILSTYGIGFGYKF